MTRGKSVAALTAVALPLIGAAAALAANPQPGKRYAGIETNVSKIEGFSAPVRFSVAANGVRLQGFTYGTIGCFGAGGFRPGVNPYTKSSLIRVGAIPVASNGSFSISNVKSSYHSSKYGYTYTTTSTVKGKFVSRKKATGTITFSQTYKPKTGKGSTCTLTVPRGFKATVKK